MTCWIYLPSVTWCCSEVETRVATSSFLEQMHSTVWTNISTSVTIFSLTSLTSGPYFYSIVSPSDYSASRSTSISSKHVWMAHYQWVTSPLNVACKVHWTTVVIVFLIMVYVNNFNYDICEVKTVLFVFVSNVARVDLPYFRTAISVWISWKNALTFSSIPKQSIRSSGCGWQLNRILTFLLVCCR